MEASPPLREVGELSEVEVAVLHAVVPHTLHTHTHTHTHILSRNTYTHTYLLQESSAPQRGG